MPIVQSEEHYTFNVGVMSSSLIRHTIADKLTKNRRYQGFTVNYHWQRKLICGKWETTNKDAK